jgi:hypothetical protein
MLTNSAREMLEFFESDIIEIEAEASLDTRNKDELLRDYGLQREQLSREKVTIHYHEIRDSDGPENPLTSEMSDEILRQVHRHLGEYDQDGVPDLAVSKLVLRVTSPEIEEVTRAVSDEFELTFISDQAETGTVARTERLNHDKGLYHDLGFEYRHLNLRSVVETRAKYAEQSDGKLMGWGGPDDVRPRCSRELAQAVKASVLPDEYGELKFYQVSDDDVLELAMMGGGDVDE